MSRKTKKLTETEEIDDRVLAEELREHILTLEQEAGVVTEKLSIAKERGLTPQANRCRDLLRQLLVERTKKQEELKALELRIREADAKAFAAEFSEELDALAEHVEIDVLKMDEELPQPPTVIPTYYHHAKSKRLSIISWAIALVGIFSGLIGALIYMLLVEYAFFPFKWWDLAIFGGIAVVLVIVALFVGGASNRHRRIAQRLSDELKEKQAEYEAALASALEERNAAWKNENVDAVLDAYRLEQMGDDARARKKAQGRFSVVSDSEALKKAAPVAAACAAAGAVALALWGRKSAQKRKAKKVRKDVSDRMN
ncbi:MAG: hypothetical protein IKJ35_08015 [Clostridia bacterium]|nr:hypothetical protein [Clostridia bacterium]